MSRDGRRRRTVSGGPAIGYKVHSRTRGSRNPKERSMSRSISRRSFLRRVAGSAAVALPGAALAAARSAAGAKPNVILAMTDDQGWGDIAGT